MRFRYYDSRVRGFLSRDPLEDDSLSNLYAGFENNPSTFVDPMGLYVANPAIVPGSDLYNQIQEETGKVDTGPLSKENPRLFAHWHVRGLRLTTG